VDDDAVFSARVKKCGIMGGKKIGGCGEKRKKRRRERRVLLATNNMYKQITNNY
jgi:hypothetical protein